MIKGNILNLSFWDTLKLPFFSSGVFELYFLNVSMLLCANTEWEKA